ncbi:glycosyltransferase family 4 protein [Hyphomonas sp.]|uniref:glycosyltransferase family 4 protein n=1 Tax=Hyphomonas sp. TaxID=87 RepID=UPI003918AF66
MVERALPAWSHSVSLVALFIVPFLVSVFVCGLMIQFGPKDAPDGGRKVQVAPVPSSGGMGILAGLVTGAAVLAAGGEPVAALLGQPPLAGVAAFTVFAALLGWYDDSSGMPPLPKLLALLGAAVISAQTGPVPEHLWLGGLDIGLGRIAGVLLVAAWIFVMANAVNFMDGANGIALGSALIILAALAFLLVPHAMFAANQDAAAILIGLLLAGAASIGGFLVWNLKGRLFAGDAGSLSVGGLLGGASVTFAVNGPVLIPLTLCLPILIDVFLTLGWRAMKGRPLMQAHRDHAYQLLLRSGWSHGRVARLWWGMTALCAGAVLAGPVASLWGADGSSGGPQLDMTVFGVLLVAGVALWVRQRVTLGRALEG